LSSLRAASEAHQRFAGAAPQSHGPEEATRMSRASRASGANSAEILGACRELPGQELLVPGGDGLGLRDQVQRLPRWDRQIPQAHPPHLSRRKEPGDQASLSLSQP